MKIYDVIALLTVFSLAPVAKAQGGEEQPHMLGLAFQSDAVFLGADKQGISVIPLANWQMGNFFARSTKGLGEAGVHWQLDHGFSLGSQVAFELGRNSADSDLLQQLKIPDIAHGASLGVQLEYNTAVGPAPLYALVRLRQRSGSERGALADLRIELGVFGNDWLGLQTYIQATWADQRAFMSDFGISPASAVNSTIVGYSPAAGIRDTLVGLAGKIDINRQWMLVSAIERRQLRGDAASSPIAEQNTNSVLTLGTLHRF